MKCEHYRLSWIWAEHFWEGSLFKQIKNECINDGKINLEKLEEICAEAQEVIAQLSKENLKLENDNSSLQNAYEAAYDGMIAGLKD